MLLAAWPLFLLTVTPPAPALPRADWVLEVPRLDAVSDLLTFFERAGRRSALLRPDNWLGELQVTPPVDPRDAAALEAEGIDAKGPWVVSVRAHTRMGCFRLSHPERFEARFEERRKSRTGPPARLARRKDQACVLEGATPADAREVTAALARAFRTQGVPRVWTPNGHADLRVVDDALQLEGESRSARAFPPPLAKPGTLPRRTASGVFFLQGTFDPRALAERTEPDLLRLCGACPKAPLHALMRFLGGETTGELLWRLEGLRRRPDLSTRASGLRALRYAGAFALLHPERARAALEPLIRDAGGKAQGEGWILPLDGNPLAFAVEHNLLWISSDAEALAHLRESPTSTKPSLRGAFARLDGRAAAHALEQISFFDLLRQPELAPLAVASTEIGPVLEGTDALEATVQPGPAGGVRFSFLWRLLL